jgi:ketosteroid isomerase-like protein
MSQENVELIRRGTECWLRGDFEGWLETIDPEVGWDVSTHPLPDVPNRGRGREAFLADMLGTYMSGWNDYSAEIEEVSEAGEEVILVLHEVATMRDTGVRLERDLVLLWTVSEGRGAFLRAFRTKAEAVEAAGGSGPAMPRENVEIARAVIHAVNRGDWDAVVHDAAPSFQWDNSRAIGADNRGVFSLEEAVEFFRGVWELWQWAWIEINESIPAGDHVVVPHTAHLRGRDGIEVKARTTWLFTIRKGRIERICLYQERHEALEAAGLSE